MESITHSSNWCFIIVNNFFKPFCDTLDIPGNALKNITPFKMDNIGLKKKYSSLKMDSITVISLKTLAKQHGIKGYYKLRKAELIQKLEDHPDVDEQVLMPGLEIHRNTTRSVNTSAILDDPISDDKTHCYNQHKILLLKAYKKSKTLLIGCWITYHQHQRWSMKLSNRLRI